MQYFDLNIPYLEDPQSGKTTPSERAARKKTRLKLVVKAVELGYSGVAYNRSINGVMSESDRCSATLFPLSNLLAISPSLSSSASFHRRLLSGPHAASSPFRQYTRITISVDNPSQSSSLNSGNPILKTYDLVAVRPMNQVAFDQACQFSEVDLIAIDLSDKMPFRMKLPMVKAAIARGVYFEITYSSLIVDVQVRRQVICNAKLLVDWTRGKNLIVSSAAPSVLEFRGPNDVANLLSLLGLAAEHAKAAISKNCSSLIAKTLKKKQFFKEAIRVDTMSSTNISDLKKPWIIDSMEWDPICSGEGDLLLEDLAKSFSEASKGSETLKPNGFTSSVSNIGSHGLKVTNTVTEIKKAADVKDSLAAFERPTLSKETETTLISCSQRKPMSLFSIPSDHHEDISNTSLNPFLLESEIVSTDTVNKTMVSDILDIGVAPIMMQEDQTSIFSQKINILNTESILKRCNDSKISAQSDEAIYISETTEPIIVDDINADSNSQNFTGKYQSDPLLISSDCSDQEVLEVTDKEVSVLADKIVDLDSSDEGKDCEYLLDRDPSVKGGLPINLDSDDEVNDTNIMLNKDPEDKANSHLSTKSYDMSPVTPSERISTSNYLLNQDEVNHSSKIATKSAKRRIQQRGYIRFPFKHFLHVPFKRKAVANRHKIMKRLIQQMVHSK